MKKELLFLLVIGYAQVSRAQFEYIQLDSLPPAPNALARYGFVFCDGVKGLFYKPINLVQKVVATDSSDNPNGGDFPKYNSNGTITWEQSVTLGGSTNRVQYLSGSTTFSDAFYWQNTNKTIGVDMPTGLNATESIHASKPSGTNDEVYDSYGAASRWLARSAGGTRLSPTATSNAQSMLVLGAMGHTGSAFVTTPRATLTQRATQSWTSSYQGSDWIVQVTPNNTAAPVTILNFSSNGIEVQPTYTLRIFDSDGTNAGIFSPVDLTANRTYSTPNASGDMPVVLDRAPTMLKIENTTTETDAYAFNVAGGALGTTKTLRVVLHGDFLNGTLSSQNLTIRIKFGGTPLYDDVVSISQGSNRRPVLITLYLSNQNSASAQFLTGTVDIGNNSVPTTGIGGIDTTGGGAFLSIASNGSSSISTTSANTFKITVQFATQSTSISFRRQYAYAVIE